MVEAIVPANAGMLTELTQTVAFLAVVGAGLYWFFHFNSKNELETFTFKSLYPFFLTHFTLYTLCSWLITGAFLSTYRVEQYLYVANLVVIGLLLKRTNADFQPMANRPRQWTMLLAVIFVLLVMAALIAINSHGVWERAAKRF